MAWERHICTVGCGLSSLPSNNEKGIHTLSSRVPGSTHGFPCVEPKDGSQNETLNCVHNWRVGMELNDRCWWCIHFWRKGNVLQRQSAPRLSWAHHQPATHSWSLLESAAPGRCSQCGTHRFPRLTANPQHTLYFSARASSVYNKSALLVITLPFVSTSDFLNRRRVKHHFIFKGCWSNRKLWMAAASAWRASARCDWALDFSPPKSPRWTSCDVCAPSAGGDDVVHILEV